MGYIYFCSDRQQTNPTVGTAMSELVISHLALLVFEGQPFINAAFPLPGQPRGILAFGCRMIPLCQTSEDGSEAGPRASAVQGCTGKQCSDWKKPTSVWCCQHGAQASKTCPTWANFDWNISVLQSPQAQGHKSSRSQGNSNVQAQIIWVWSCAKTNKHPPTPEHGAAQCADWDGSAGVSWGLMGLISFLFTPARPNPGWRHEQSCGLLPSEFPSSYSIQVFQPLSDNGK